MVEWPAYTMGLVFFFMGLAVAGFGFSTAVDRYWPKLLRIAGWLLGVVGVGLSGYSIYYAFQATI